MVSFVRETRPLLTGMFDRQSPDSLGAVVSAFESETVGVMVRTSPRNERTVLFTVAGMIVLSIGLMSFAKLDKVVTGAGRIVTTAGSLFLSPLDKSIIKEIHVKVGDVVRKGQVLATMDPTFASADLVQMQQKADSDRAAVAREQAELANKPYVPAGLGAYETLQEGIWRQRQAELKSSVADFNARITNAEATVGQLQADVENFRKRLDVAQQLEQMNIALGQRGFGSKLRTLTSTDTRVEIERQLADSTNQITAARQTVLSLRAQKSAFVEKWDSDLASQLVADKNDLDKAHDDLQRAQKFKDLGELRAPVDGVVLKIGKISKGSIAASQGDSSTEPLFTLVPVGGPVEAEVDVDSRDVGFLHEGDPVAIKLDAYRYLEYGTAKGVITNISQGSFQLDPETNQPRAPFFQVRVAVTDTHLRNVPRDFHLTPGMTLVADVVIGHRTILSYLVEGVLRTGKESMREP